MENRKFIVSKGDYHWLIQGEPLEDWVEIFEDQNQLPDLNYVMPYDANRMHTYPSIANQLDMLWHELNASGSITTEGNWFQTIQTVKQQFPKP